MFYFFHVLACLLFRLPQRYPRVAQNPVPRTPVPKNQAPKHPVPRKQLLWNPAIRNPVRTPPNQVEKAPNAKC